MKCPFCLSKTNIYNSRATHQATQTWRRHICSACAQTFTTREKVDWTGRVNVKTTSSETPYSRERLLLSLVRAGEGLDLPPTTLSELADTIELQLQQSHFFQGSTQDAALITEVAIRTLQRYNPHVALQYVHNVYHGRAPLALLKELVQA